MAKISDISGWSRKRRCIGPSVLATRLFQILVIRSAILGDNLRVSII
jgi:hypothetical protein